MSSSCSGHSKCSRSSLFSMSRPRTLSLSPMPNTQKQQLNVSQSLPDSLSSLLSHRKQQPQQQKHHSHLRNTNSSIPPIRGLVTRLLKRRKAVSIYNSIVIICFAACFVFLMGTLTGIGYSGVLDSVLDSDNVLQSLQSRSLWDSYDFALLATESDFATHSYDSFLDGPQAPIPSTISEYIQLSKPHHWHFHQRILDSPLFRFFFHEHDES